MLKPLGMTVVAFAALGALAIAGDTYASAAHLYQVAAYEHDYGRVIAIDAVRERGHSSGGGALLGGVVGGVLGHQVGSGRGKDAATVAGAVGGAVVGNEVEKHNSSEERFKITVRFRDGRETTFEQASPRGLRVGDRVHVEGERIVRD